MSDVFNNETGRKTKILELHGVPSLPENVIVESIYPGQPPATSQVRYTTRDVVELVRSLRIPAFKPHFIHEMIEVPLSTSLVHETLIEFNELKRAQQLKEFHTILKNDGERYFILPDNQVYLPAGPNLRLPSYNPTYYNKPYDKPMLNEMTYLLTSPDQVDPKTGRNWGEMFEGKEETFKAFLKAINKTMCSTGTFTGQLTRFASMRDIRRGLKGKHKPKTLKELNISMERFAQELEVTLPVTDELDTFALTSVPSAWIYKDEINGDILEELPKLKLRTTAGPPFPSGYKKGAGITSAIVMMDNVLLDLSDVVKDNGKMTLPNFVEKYWYIFMGYMFPKEERYDRADIMTKTRNIISMNMISHMLFSIIIDSIDEASKFNCLNFDTPSLKGFSPWKGGMHLFVKKLAEATETIDFVYADNWYIYYLENDNTFTFFSIDNEKAEANATPDLAQALMYYFLSRSYIKDNVVQFSPTWAYLALNILPATAVDAVAVFKNLQLKIPGLSSGSRITFHVNHAVTTKHRMIWKKMGSPRPGSNAFAEVNKMAGVNVKIELEVSNYKAKLKNLMRDTPKDGLMQDIRSDEPSIRDWPIVDADLLGYDICWSHEIDQFLPVLRESRLMASAAYPKKTADDIVDSAAYSFFRMVRYETLNMMGSLTQPLLFWTNKMMAHSIREPLRRALGAAEFSVAAQNTYSDLLPTITEVLEVKKINVEFTCDRAILYKLHLLMPQPTPPKQSKRTLANFLDLKEVAMASKTSKVNPTPAMYAGLPLYAMMIPTYKTKLDLFKQLQKLLSTQDWTKNIKSWADEVEDLFPLTDAETELKSSYNEILTAVTASIDTLLIPAVDYDNNSSFLPAIYETDPSKLADPYIGYHLPYQPTEAAVRHRNLAVGQPTLTRSQRKNQKAKAKMKQLRADAAAIRASVHE